jgi:hypothetical protein
VFEAHRRISAREAAPASQQAGDCWLRVFATFLNYVCEKYDKELVKKLNAAMRQGKYSDDLFKDATGKTLQELDDEWRTTLKS